MATENEQSSRTIGKYEILGTLGRGAMGVVYKARDPQIGRTVAIKTLRKVLPTELQQGNKALERFKIEARAAGNLRHPNLITIFEVNIEGDVPYIVMDFVEGESLSALLTRHARLRPEVTFKYMDQLVSGLDYAHSQGVLHRDIKPSNIVIDRNDRVCILDFGVASINDTFAEGRRAPKDSLVMGTPGYMSPEQILNKELDPRSDLFSVAVLVFECLSGKRPYAGESFATVVENILNGRPLALTRLVPELPMALETELGKALSKFREDRFNSGKEMIDAFRATLKSRAESSAGQDDKENRGPARQRKNSVWRPISGAVFSAGQSGPGEKFSARGGFGEPPPGLRKPAHLEAPRPEVIDRAGKLFSATDLTLGNGRAAARSSALRPLIIFIAVLCLFLIFLLIWKLFLSPENQLPGQSGQDVRLLAPEDNLPDTAAPIETLELETLPPMREGIAVAEMSDDEVLAAIAAPGNSEALILEGLAEALERKLLRLVQAAGAVLEHDSYVVRLTAVQTLEKLNDPRTVLQLVPLLDDTDPQVRSAVARALGNLGDSRALAYLTARAAVEDNLRVKEQLQAAISKIKK